MDTYRPGESRRAYPRESDSYRPRRYDAPPPPRPRSNFDSNGMYHFQGSRDWNPSRNSNPRPRPAYQGTRPPPPGLRDDRHRRLPPPPVYTAANRPLFKIKHEAAIAFSDANSSSEAKFRNLDELTDSEEEEMTLSEDDLQDSHLSKRVRLTGVESGVARASKWSNPDPYTSLPAGGDVTAKRTDVVKLIRKARIDTDRSLQQTKRSDDFISFDAETHNSSEKAPLSSIPYPTESPPISPPPPPSLPPAPRADSLGKRKRGFEVEDQGAPSSLDPQGYADENVKGKWAATAEISSTPWLHAHPTTDIAGVALHKEIIDFYDWVKPKSHEEEVRGALFERLNKILQKFEPGGKLKAFGSYAAGLYLPIADMDLVYLTRAFRPGQSSKARSGRLVYNCAAHLKKERIAQGVVVPIAHAKVPIIKFVDKISGVKIDLSFDNDTGINAIDTFHKWKKEYPIMPIIVSVVKQYLMIRELNDVSTGGLGGFSTICLVTSFLQHLPITQHPVNLGEVLLEFFNYYGNVFDQKLAVLRLDPPAYLNKATHPIRFSDKDNTRLTIIDPHRCDNNISGGTKHVDVILKSFSKAHRALVARLAAYEGGLTGDSLGSLLACLIGGNFTAYEQQRKLLHDLSSGVIEGPRHALPARPPKVDDHARYDRSSPAASDSDSGGGNVEQRKKRKGSNKSERRAERLKELRPELAASIRNSISQLDALKLGGYKTPADMSRDLDLRESAAAKLASAKQKQQKR